MSDLAVSMLDDLISDLLPQSEPDSDPPIINTPLNVRSGQYLPLLQPKSTFELDFDFIPVQKFLESIIPSLEKEHGIKFLLCVERSSHVWGTSHPKSDHDVKAIFCSSQRSYYSPQRSITEFKRVFGPRSKDSNQSDEKSSENELDLELTCVDILKISRQLCSNDPNIFEIFHSPIVYFERKSDIFNNFRKCVQNIVDWKSLLIHYYGWSYGNYRQLISAKKTRMNKKPLKSIFVVWRGILSCDWLLSHKSCQNMPLYLPDLIDASTLIDTETKQLLMRVLNNDLRKSRYDLSLASLPLKDKCETLFVDIIQPNIPKHGDRKKNTAKASHTNELENLCCTIIEDI